MKSRLIREPYTISAYIRLNGEEKMRQYCRVIDYEEGQQVLRIGPEVEQARSIAKLLLRMDGTLPQLEITDTGMVLGEREPVDMRPFIPSLYALRLEGIGHVLSSISWEVMRDAIHHTPGAKR